MTALYDITRTCPDGAVHADRISAEDGKEACETLLEWIAERSILGVPYRQPGATYEIHVVERGSRQSSFVWRWPTALDMYRSELTPAGEQTVIPGCERDDARTGAVQLDLF